MERFSTYVCVLVDERRELQWTATVLFPSMLIYYIKRLKYSQMVTSVRSPSQEGHDDPSPGGNQVIYLTKLHGSEYTAAGCTC